MDRFIHAAMWNVCHLTSILTILDFRRDWDIHWNWEWRSRLHTTWWGPCHVCFLWQTFFLIFCGLPLSLLGDASAHHFSIAFLDIEKDATTGRCSALRAFSEGAACCLVVVCPHVKLDIVGAYFHQKFSNAVYYLPVCICCFIGIALAIFTFQHYLITLRYDSGVGSFFPPYEIWPAQLTIFMFGM